MQATDKDDDLRRLRARLPRHLFFYASLRRHTGLPRKYCKLLDLPAEESRELVRRFAGDEFDAKLEQALMRVARGCFGDTVAQALDHLARRAGRRHQAVERRVLK